MSNTPPAAQLEHEVIHGESLAELRALPSAKFDALITDPPYSSGGLHKGARAADPTDKYCHDGDARGRPSFDGDARDQRSWILWCTLWLTEARRAVKRGGYALVFTDWRQLPALTDAIQAGGWTWRGVIAWDKGAGSRAPHKGYFRHQCEFVVWASNGALAVPPVTDPRGGPWPGCYQYATKKTDKHHMTGKPTGLMRDLVRVVQPGGLILDPFAGSGTTAVAAQIEGRRSVSIEQEAAYVHIIRHRLGVTAERQRLGIEMEAEACNESRSR